MGLFNRKMSSNKSVNIETSSYYGSSAFQSNRQKILDALSSLPQQDTPPGWERGATIAIGGLQYVAFSEDSHYLLVVSSSGRSIFELETMQKVSRDYEKDGDWLDENRLLCTGIGPIKNISLRITGIGGGGLPSGNKKGESLYLAAPQYPCYDVVYQPNFQNCLIPGHDHDCIIVYRGYVKYCGFSWDGKTMIVVDEDINIWHRLD